MSEGAGGEVKEKEGHMAHALRGNEDKLATSSKLLEVKSEHTQLSHAPLPRIYHVPQYHQDRHRLRAPYLQMIGHLCLQREGQRVIDAVRV